MMRGRSGVGWGLGWEDKGGEVGLGARHCPSHLDLIVLGDVDIVHMCSA